MEYYVLSLPIGLMVRGLEQSTFTTRRYKSNNFLLRRLIRFRDHTIHQALITHATSVGFS